MKYKSLEQSVSEYASIRSTPSITEATFSKGAFDCKVEKLVENQSWKISGKIINFCEKWEKETNDIVMCSIITFLVPMEFNSLGGGW